MNTIEERLSPLWCGVVGTTDVRADTDFLDSGGNSLKAVYLAAAIQDEFAVPVDAIEIIEQGIFAKIAALIETRLLS